MPTRDMCTCRCGHRHEPPNPDQRVADRAGGTRVPIDELLSNADAARYLGISKSTLNNWRALDTGPPYVRLGRPRYRRSDIDTWLIARMKRRKRNFPKSPGLLE